MNGAESLVATLVESGIDTCFSNPGTSEMHFVAATDKVPGMRPILCLFEGVVTGAADGYGRMKGKPAATLLHLGPGLANGLANLHNARRASTPIVNIVGDHATYHGQYDAPLTSDVVGFARPVSGWIHSSTSAATVATDGARAVAASMEGQGQIATLILPADTAWNNAQGPAQALPVPKLPPADPRAIEKAAAALKSAKNAVLLVGSDALYGEGLANAGRVAAATGARLLCPTTNARRERGAGRVLVQPLPYFSEMIEKKLEGIDTLVVAGTKPPVSFFAYPGKASWLTPEGCEIIYASHSHENSAAALADLADAVGGPKSPTKIVEKQTEMPSDSDRLDQFSVGKAIAHLLPDDAIICDEANTSGTGPSRACTSAAPHDWLSLTGGSIGQGLPLATGAAVACPDRKTICLHGDGGAMYTPQSLWTQARENLDVTTIIFANKSYAILNVEFGRVGVGKPGPKALAQLDLRNPELNWVQLAQSMGVSASRSTTVKEFREQFAHSMNEKGPHLIEVVL
ncbi:acetolactate synthase large subunit [Sneathiella sp. HT1-7]|uniref:acetolactate synthase large subunit n=1 Tax=Sneathiella sp. HT1-7 TaxID=2887192 RepID=UPI001D13286E|nr:acetolactate synthase large subunit [Sneathiella sp. HT1-7]MCC3306337.1 acetolactate synthase large subunit [Sneathiella sp. HT1-7]